MPAEGVAGIPGTCAPHGAAAVQPWVGAPAAVRRNPRALAAGVAVPRSSGAVVPGRWGPADRHVQQGAAGWKNSSDSREASRKPNMRHRRTVCTTPPPENGVNF